MIRPTPGVGLRLRLLATVVPLVLVLSSCMWPAFRNGPERTGVNSSETAIGVANVAGLGLTWTAGSGSGSRSSPAVSNGVLYVVSSTGELRAFSAAGTTGCSGTPKTCSPLWTAGSGASGSSPAVSDGRVYVGSNFFVTGDPFDTVDGLLSAYDDAGSTGCSGTPKVCTPLWTAASDNIASASPVVANGFLYMGADGLQAYDPAGAAGCGGAPKVCAPLWGSSASGSSTSSPAVAGGVAYQVSGGTLAAYDAAGSANCSGTPVLCTPTWTATLPVGADATLDSSPAVSGSLLYVGGADGKVRAYKTAATFPQCTTTVPKTCNPAWTRATGGPVRSSAAVADGVVYIGSDDDKLYALDAATGSVLWTATTGGDIRSSPTVANGVVYVGSDDGKVYAFDAAGTLDCSGTPTTCSPLWTHATGGPVRSSPVVVSGTLYVGSDDGTLYAFAL